MTALAIAYAAIFAVLGAAVIAALIVGKRGGSTTSSATKLATIAEESVPAIASQDGDSNGRHNPS